MKSNVIGVLGLDATNDDARVGGWVNDAIVDILKRTHVYVKSETLALAAGTSDYDLQSTNTEILAIEDIYLTSNGQNLKVRRLSTTDLMNLRLFQVTTAPVQMYALSGANLLMVYPTPSQADTLTIYYVPRPTALSGNSDDPSATNLGGIPSEFHYGIELYSMWKAGDAFDDEGSGGGENYRRLYLGDPTAPPGTPQRFGFIGQMKRDIRDKGGKHLAGVLIPPKGRRPYVPNAGVDTGPPYAN